MKVKIFCDHTIDSLEKKVNKFIKNKKVIDIKFSSDPVNDLVLVVYEEKKENEF